MWLIVIVLIVINIYSLKTLKDPANLRELKEKYTRFLENVPPQYPMLKNRSIINGYYDKGKEIGYNMNKGDEIGICMNGTSNQMFHVLIHELAHSTVKEYDHSEKFWRNFKDLKNHCSSIGIYDDIPAETEFCGKYIRD